MFQEWSKIVLCSLFSVSRSIKYYDVTFLSELNVFLSLNVVFEIKKSVLVSSNKSWHITNAKGESVLKRKIYQSCSISSIVQNMFTHVKFPALTRFFVDIILLFWVLHTLYCKYFDNHDKCLSKKEAKIGDVFVSVLHFICSLFVFTSYACLMCMICSHCLYSIVWNKQIR